MDKSKRKLLDIFSKLEEVKPLNLHYNSKVLIVDGINTFIRSFAAVNHNNGFGNHVGGITGFLKSLGSAIKQIQPTRCVLVFDGESGSINRKYLYPEYKGNRNNPRILNYKSFSNKKEEDASKYNEISRLMDYLNYLPVISICIDKLEADDVIGNLANKVYNTYDDSETYIMSSDNDFLQLVNDRVFVYSPTKKILYKEETVLKEFNVHPSNFLLYKSLVGDDADNIPGITGLGEKNVVSLFEFLKEPTRKNLEDIYNVCSNPTKKSILYERVLNMRNILEVFYNIMNLKEPNISKEDDTDINNQFYVKPPTLRKHDFINLLRQDRINDQSLYNNWINLFSILNNF